MPPTPPSPGIWLPELSARARALKWLLLAYRTNEPMARNLLNEIIRHIPEKVQLEARQQAAAFRARLPVSETR